jgi:cyclohexyl-isocyanide hydratase
MSDSKSSTLRIGIVLFDKATLLDFAAPWDVFKRLPHAKTHLISHTLDQVTASGMPVAPTKTWTDCGKLDVICVPGGVGHIRAMTDDVLLDHLRRQAEDARYVTAVCTGALVLGAAGLLNGYRATTHWMSHSRLAQFGAKPVNARVVKDRNRVTGGGVTAGLDFALTLAAELCGVQVAKEIQLSLEYAPDPPFHDGHPDTADAETVALVKAQFAGDYVKLMTRADADAVTNLKDR